ncbi:MAG: rhomboid family intramembrane serine protease [Deltaproteobacteria bacterium]|nr:MAG: rhomboid family intramembrane serine protease [Deltaproteobacteria bacterium]
MIPLKDENPTEIFPFVTIGFIVVNAIIFLFQFAQGPNFQHLVLRLGVIPYEITHFTDIHPAAAIPVPLTLISSMFMHGGFLHLGGNMLYLWIFGNNIEDSMGHIKFIFFYLICGLLASLSHIMIEPNSQIPMIGASGAISGVLGAYILLYPRAQVITLVPIFFFIRIMRLPAVLFLGIWFLLQLVSSGGGVAWYAHIGGFIAGFALIFLFSKKGKRRIRKLKRRITR